MGVSYQKGWVRPRGRKWHGCFRRSELDSATNETKLVTHSFVLGLRTEMSKSQAREKLEDEIAKLGGRATGDQAAVNGSATFAWFVKNRYLPLKEGDWREETAKIKKYLIRQTSLIVLESIASKTSIRSFFRLISINWRKTVPRTECCRFGLTCATSLRKQSIRAFFRRTQHGSSNLPRTCARWTGQRSPGSNCERHWRGSAS